MTAGRGSIYARMTAGEDAEHKMRNIIKAHLYRLRSQNDEADTNDDRINYDDIWVALRLWHSNAAKK